jgi:hypothetical protein
MPELTTAWVTLAATTRGMEADMRRAFERVERDAKINPKVDRSGLTLKRAARPVVSRRGSSPRSTVRSRPTDLRCSA